MARTLALQKNGADPTGAPDFTLPVSILAQVIESLRVDIAAQSIPTLNINIAGISQGITVTTTVSNMPSSFPLPSDQVSALQQVTIQNVAAGLVFNVNVSHIDAVLNINNWPSVYPLPPDQISTLQQITIQNVAAGLLIPIDIKQVTAQLNISNFPSSYPLPDTQVSALQQITIQNVAAGLYIPINIAKADATVNSNATISGVVAGVYIPITIHNIESGVVFDVNVTNVQSGVVFNVNITGTPTVNIQTSGGANIVIDKLTQGAYTERQSTLANNGATATMASQCLYYKRGKFFPRGCRGFIRSIEIYCDNAGSASHTFTIKISPMPGMGPIATFTLSVPAYSGAAWRAVTVGRFWNYDSLFIWVSSDDDAYGRLGFDTDAPSDYYQSTDEVSWVPYGYRFWFRVNMAGETVGDLPVSGTVNTIAIPSVSAIMKMGGVSIPVGVETSVVKVNGCGECDMMICEVAAASYSHQTYFFVYCDGQHALTLSPIDLYLWGFTASSPGFSLLKYTTNGDCYFAVTKKLCFRRSLEVTAKNQYAGQTVTVSVFPSLVV
jgi:hypothetical protein